MQGRIIIWSKDVFLCMHFSVFVSDQLLVVEYKWGCGCALDVCELYAACEATVILNKPITKFVC